jgi:hypothetical protein
MSKLPTAQEMQWGKRNKGIIDLGRLELQGKT